MQVGYVVILSSQTRKALIDFSKITGWKILQNNILKEKERFSWDKMTNSIRELAP